jgi:hypothetical protein
LVLDSLPGALNMQLSFLPHVTRGDYWETISISHEEGSEVTQWSWGDGGLRWWNGLEQEQPGLVFCFPLTEHQAVQGVLCEGDRRQSRLLGLVRYCLEHGGQEHA